MNPHSKVKTTLKWTGTAASLSLLIIWVVSYGWTIERSTFTPQPGAYESYRLTSGSIRYIGFPWSSSPGFPAGTHWSITSTARSTQPSLTRAGSALVLPIGWGSSSHGQVPLWAPIAIFVLPTLLVWIRDRREARRTKIGHCQACNYDRHGLPAHAVCPECGANPAPSNAAVPTIV